jgi:hypothetical protein
MKFKQKQVDGISNTTFQKSFTDCIKATADVAFAFTVSGTGASFSSVAVGADNALGILRMAMGTVATNRCSIDSGNFGIILFGKGKITYQSKIRFTVLSDATNTYTQRDGFIDSISAESTDGIFFRYTNSVNAGKIQAVTRSNNTETAVDTGITVTANVWYNILIEINAGGTSAVFKINGAIVATISTNIPTAAGRETGYGCYCQRSVGTTAFNSMDCDFIDVNLSFTTER